MNKAILLCAVLGLGACAADDEPSDVPFVDSTCAEILCGWETTQGDLTPSGSWHPRQRSLELTGTPVKVTRRLSGPPVAECFNMTFLADVAPDAQLELQLDFNDDGAIDARAQVPASEWRSESVALRAPAEYRSLRVSLEKKGAGRVRISSMVLSFDRDACNFALPTTLADGAQCSTDATCSAGRCAAGVCGSCPPGGCDEGQACRSSDECRDGACAAGTCKACAKRGDCAAGDRCSLSGQCAAGACVQGARPSLTALPGSEGVCGDCLVDDDCASGHCTLGFCAGCGSDADCESGRVCRYADTFDVSSRACLPRITSTTPRGGLCERDEDCASGLRCGAPGNRAKRCGVSCAIDEDCGKDAVCASTGATKAVDPPATLALLPGWTRVPERVTTCYPRPTLPATVNELLNQPLRDFRCEVHEQCGGPATGLYCCSGKCTSATLDLETGACSTAP